MTGVTVAYQPSMLDTGGPSLAPLAGLERHPLSHGAWVDILPGWVRGSEEVLRTLLDQVQWRSERRWMYDGQVDVPRLLRWYGEGEPLPHPVLAEARQRLSAHYAEELGEPFVTAGMCLYRDGRDSVAWHGDTVHRRHTRLGVPGAARAGGPAAGDDTMVAIVAFGSARPLLLRPRGGGPSLRFPLGHGDLLVMGGSCQRTWEHAVPKTTKRVGPRVSVQFRPAGVS